MIVFNAASHVSDLRKNHFFVFSFIYSGEQHFNIIVNRSMNIMEIRWLFVEVFLCFVLEKHQKHWMVTQKLAKTCFSILCLPVQSNSISNYV